LEYGEAHVAIRGRIPPRKRRDYCRATVSQTLGFGLFAAKFINIDAFGIADSVHLSAHQFVGSLDGSSRRPLFALDEQARHKEDQLAL